MTSLSAPSVVGIIAEYNPFHTGHQYLIRQAKKLTGAKYAIAVMSGDFVQRGEPAIFNKYLRTRMALHGGADLVIEIPSLFAVSSAEDFAAAGVSLLHRFHIVDFLCFGSESGQLSTLQEIAHVLAAEPKIYQDQLRENMRAGLSFPAARAHALSLCLPDSKELQNSLNTPNNILGIEYLKALSRLDSTIKPLTISRRGEGYHSTKLDGITASASAIRRELSMERPDFSQISFHIPEELLPLYEKGAPLFPDDFSALLNYSLLNLFRESESTLSDFVDWMPEMASRMKNHLLDHGSWTERAMQLKTKNITYTRASRSLLHLLLGHKREDFCHFKQSGYALYGRILGFRQSAVPLLSRIKEHSDIPLVTKTADARQLLSPDAYKLFSYDLYASHIYQSVYCQKHHDVMKNEYNQPVTIL